MDPAHLRAQADSLDGEAIELARGGDVRAGVAKAAEAIRLRQLADAVEALDRTHLHPSRRVSTLSKVDPPVNVSRGAAISAAKTKANTRWQQRLQERGLSIPGWVDTQPAKSRPSVEQARSWVKPKGKGGRAIPAAWAARLATQFADPDLTQADAWPCGIR